MAIGIGTNASYLGLELELKKPQSVKISVFNISDEAGIFQIFPDELNDWIKISPNNFRLEAGENKEIEITVFGKKRGIRATNLSVLAQPLDRQSFSVGSGLKIPLRLRTKDDKTHLLASISESLSKTFPSILFAIISLIFLIIFLSLTYFNRKNFKK